MTVDIRIGDCRQLLAAMPDESVHCVVTSPPYWGLRDYGVDGQLGMEATYTEHVSVMVDVFQRVRRVLRRDGTLWLNYGDTYASSVNGRSAADVKLLTDDDRTFRDKPFSTVQGALKPKDMCGMPWRVAFALQADGWYLRQDIIWSKPNPMPESVTDRCTKAHEYLFLLSKNGGNPLLWRANDTREWSENPDLDQKMPDGESPRWRGFDYFYDQDAVAEPVTESTISRLGQPNIANQQGSDRVPGKTNGAMKAVPPRFGGSKYGDNDAPEFQTKSGNDYELKDGRRNRRSVWTVATQPFKEAHFATFPPDLIEPCIKAGCPKGGTVLDPFGGAGTTGLVADRLGRNAILLELNPTYAEMARRRIADDAGMFAQVAAQ